jgi:hypothetical protein
MYLFDANLDLEFISAQESTFVTFIGPNLKVLNAFWSFKGIFLSVSDLPIKSLKLAYKILRILLRQYRPKTFC